MTKCLALCIHQRLARAWDVFTHNWHILYADEKSLNPSVKLLCLCIAEGGSGAWHLPEPSRAELQSPLCSPIRSHRGEDNMPQGSSPPLITSLPTQWVMH